MLQLRIDLGEALLVEIIVPGGFIVGVLLRVSAGEDAFLFVEGIAFFHEERRVRK